jgi:hypothetical protein
VIIIEPTRLHWTKDDGIDACSDSLDLRKLPELANEVISIFQP